MSEFGVKKLALKCLALALLVLSLLFFSQNSTKTLSASSQAAQGQLRTPSISVEAQEGSPFRILSTEIQSAQPGNFKLQALVQNQSAKEVRAYAITSYTSTGKEQNGYTQFMNLTQRSGIWRPTEIRAITVSDNRDTPIVGVRLAVDFVEFSDGITWGPDTEKSRDMLAGMRAGAKAEKQRIRQLLKNKGRAAVTSDIQAEGAEGSEAPADDHRSPQWSEGFRNGVGSIRRRLRQALQSNHTGELEAELNKPFDTSEENPK
jgi:hypothetical protein